MNQKIFAGQVNAALAQSLARYHHAVNIVPKLITKLIREEGWRDFVSEVSHQPCHFDTFKDFIRAPVLEGLETTPEALLAMCGEDEEAKGLIRRELEKGVPK